MADRHSGALIGLASVAVVAGGVLIAIGVAEVNNTARALSSNGWFDLGVVFVILGVALAVIGGVLHFRREVEGPTAPRAIDAPPPAAAQSAVPSVNPDEFRPYHAESGEFPDGKALTFGFDHINDHPDAYNRLNPRRCTVDTPSGMEVSATRRNRYFQYPQEFENAPPVRPGLYRFRLEGQLANGKWEYITRGEHEVKGPPLLLTVEDEKWDLWLRAGYICALLVTITNTTSQAITVVNVGIGTDWQRGPEDALAEISDEDRVSLRDERRAREDRNHYGRPLVSRRRSWLRRTWRSVIPANGQVSGWLVTDCPRPWTGGRPRCTIRVTDSYGNTYTKVIEQRNPQHYES